jgi:molybdate transport system substrate-binding protein
MGCLRSAPAAFVLIVAVHMAGNTDAAELKVLSSGALKLALVQLVPDFQKSSSNSVTIEYDVGAAIANRIQKGESADVAIVLRSQLQTLETQGKIVQGSRVNIASVGVGVAVRKGAPKPDISSVEAFKRALFSARSVGYNDPASGSATGIYAASMLARLGIAQDLSAKIKLLTPPGNEFENVFQGLVKGEIEMQIAQISEIAISPGVELVGPLPAEIQNVTSLAVGIVTTTKAPEASRTLINFISSPAAAVLLKAHGFQPG